MFFTFPFPQLQLILLLGALAVSFTIPTIKVNYDIKPYKFIKIGENLELTCSTSLDMDLPQWTNYPEELKNDSRMKIYTDIHAGQSRLVIQKATARDGGVYECGINFEYKGKTHHIPKNIEVVVNEISNILKENVNDGLKFFCVVHAYPAPKIYWRIEYLNKEEHNGDDSSTPFDRMTLVEKSEGHLELRQFNGVNNAELFIANITKKDVGNYFCFSQNIAGTIYKNVTLGQRREAVTENLPKTSIVVDISVEPTNTAMKELDSVLTGGFEATSWMNATCLFGILMGNIMLAYIIFFLRRRG